MLYVLLRKGRKNKQMLTSVNLKNVKKTCSDNVFCWSSFQPVVVQLGFFPLCTSEAVLEVGYWLGEACLDGGWRGLEGVVLNPEQGEQRTQWVALD